MDTIPQSTPATDASGVQSPEAERDRLERLQRFLNAYWLRPENAFWMTLRSLALKQLSIQTPSIDVACGDGVFSFLHAGGEFGETFDVFEAVGDLSGVTSHHADMFDGGSERYRPKTARPADWRIDVGTDLKTELLAKAKTLDFYRVLLQQDGNDPLEIESESFATVYCNSAYWIREIDQFLRELGRIVRHSGRIVMHVKLAAMRSYTLESYDQQLGEQFLRIIDRGRRECWPTVSTRRDWERRFTRAGLEIVSATPFATRTHAHIWDIGLRPIAPLLVRMANALTPETRADIKRDWTALFMELLDPICRPDFDLFDSRSEPAEMQYVLRRM